MTHGQPSAVSNQVEVSRDEAEVTAWSVPSEVSLAKEVVRDSSGRYVLSWSYDSSNPITGFVIQCFKATEPSVCTGEVPPESRSFAFDHTMLEKSVWYSFKVNIKYVNGQ